MTACKCQDSNGTVCGVEMSTEEFEQDGMCTACADNVWAEMYEGKDDWIHERCDTQS